MTASENMIVLLESAGIALAVFVAATVLVGLLVAGNDLVRGLTGFAFLFGLLTFVLYVVMVQPA